MREVFRNRGLRRLQLAWAGSIIGSWAYSVALVVYAYDVGGAGAVGLMGLVRWLPAAAASPLAATLGDRYPRVRVMLGADLLRAAALAGMTACVLLDSPAVVVYVLAACVGVFSTAFQPAQAALLPVLARTPEELTAANVSSSTLESLGFCVGPALGGVLLAVSSTWVVFVFTGADVPLVGRTAAGAARNGRAGAGRGATQPNPRDRGRRPRHRRRPAPAARDRPLLGADARERGNERADRRLRAPAAGSRTGWGRLPQRGSWSRRPARRAWSRSRS